jgi:hypothetical protein
VLLNHESAEFIQFVNPGDLRVVEKTCAPCHADIVHDVSHSMMRHGAMLWGAALYNNGGSLSGEKLSLTARLTLPTASRCVWKVAGSRHAGDDAALTAFCRSFDPLPRFDISQPGNILRIFELGGESQLHAR